MALVKTGIVDFIVCDIWFVRAAASIFDANASIFTPNLRTFIASLLYRITVSANIFASSTLPLFIASIIFARCALSYCSSFYACFSIIFAFNFISIATSYKSGLLFLPPIY